MSDNEKPGLNEILSMMVLAAVVAVATYPILVYSGVHELLVNLSVDCTKALFKFFGLPT